MLSLKNILRLNATSCLVFGILFFLLPTQVALFLDGSSPASTVLILILGGVLIINGLHLIWASTIPLPKKELILYFSAGDFIWVIASIGLLMCKLWITTPSGIFSSVMVAIMVGFFGVMQIIKRKEMESLSTQTWLN